MALTSMISVIACPWRPEGEPFQDFDNPVSQPRIAAKSNNLDHLMMSFLLADDATKNRSSVGFNDTKNKPVETRRSLNRRRREYLRFWGYEKYFRSLINSILNVLFKF